MLPEQIKELYELSEVWYRETSFLSGRYNKHPNYKKIVEMGNEIIPYVLDDLEKNKHKCHIWFCILNTLVKPEDKPYFDPKIYGKVQKIIEIWLEWGYFGQQEKIWKNFNFEPT